jgi:trimeric autotransporter adhesin
VSNASTPNCGPGQCWYCSQCTGCCPCAAGSYCPGDDQQYSCPVNTYNARTSSNSSAVCVACPTGKLSDAGSKVCSYMMSTVAGIGPSASSSSDGLLAVNSYLNTPRSVRVDKLGIIYIADTANNKIRYVDPQTGIMNTFAGTGSASCCYDGYFATSGYLYYPYDMALDTSRNMYIADTYNHRIRKVTRSTMIISTYAGTGSAGYNGDGMYGQSTYLYYPYGVAVDSSYNVYVCDTYNQRIRKINVVTQIISTVAGTGSASYNGDGIVGTSAYLYYPSSVTVDQYGNVFIGDGYNYRVRKLSATSGIITTVVGTGSSASSSDGLPGTKTTIGYPGYVAFDASGALYIADTNYNYVRKLSNGNVSMVAGSPTSSGYSGNGGPASSATMNQPSGVAVDVYGNIYVSDRGNNIVREIYGK